MTTTTCKLKMLAAALAVVLATGCDGAATAPHPFDPVHLTQWKLPKSLREISGLALTPDQRLFAVADERAEIFELDYERGEVVKSFKVGDPTVKGDFEGIAYGDGQLHVITSDGLLLSFDEGGDGDEVDYTEQATGAGEVCEVEGLDMSAAHGFAIACKNPRRADVRDRVVVLRYADNTLTPLIDVPEAPLADAAGDNRFQPSGVRLDDTGVWLIAARQTALAHVDWDGTTHKTFRLSGQRHRQTEGLEITPDQRFILSDEGDGKRARLGVYATP